MRVAVPLVAVLFRLVSSPAAWADERPARQTPAGQTGIASWYGYQHNGRRTASGEIHNSRLATAAHRSLPFGSVVKVTDLDSGATVVVRVNDRGPYVKGRIIDLSERAARDLGIFGAGLARVSIEPITSREQTCATAP